APPHPRAERARPSPPRTYARGRPSGASQRGMARAPLAYVSQIRVYAPEAGVGTRKHAIPPKAVECASGRICARLQLVAYPTEVPSGSLSVRSRSNTQANPALLLLVALKVTRTNSMPVGASQCRYGS